MDLYGQCNNVDPPTGLGIWNESYQEGFGRRREKKNKRFTEVPYEKPHEFQISNENVEIYCTDVRTINHVFCQNVTEIKQD